MARPDYSGARWYGAHSNNYFAGNRPSSDPINKIIVHVTQGSWSGTMNWFNDGSAGVSAHYTVRSSDGFIGQSVEEKDIGYHAGWWDYNRTSIGIEHEGYVSNPDYWFTDTMYRSSAKLSAYLCKKYRIPIDRTYIIGHHQVPGCSGAGGGVGCHTDPGSGWDWNKYINLIKSYASNNVYRQTVDNSTAGRFLAKSSWGTSTYSSQKFGSDYRFTTPRDDKDFARWKVKVPRRAKYAVFARWPANPGYNPRARFFVRTVNGWKFQVVNQRINGGKWVRLGVFEMPAGDNYWVRLDSRSGYKGYIIADAVMVKRG